MTTPTLALPELHTSVDRLLAIDPASLSEFEMQSLVEAVQAERSRLAVAAAAHVRTAVRAGRLSIDHVDLFVRLATRARWPHFQAHEARLVEQCAAAVLFIDARRIMQYWAQLADDELGLRPERPDPSTLYLSQSGLSGNWRLDGDLCPVDGEIVGPERRLEREIHLEDRNNGVHRTPAQRRAAALVRMAARSVNGSGISARPLFQVIVGDESARRLCELASGTVVRPEDLEPFIDAAVMEAFLFDGPRTVISKSHQRTFRGALRRAIQVRDRRCQHSSGCPAPVVDGDIDHCMPASRGGPTSQFNARGKCWPHNRRHDLVDRAEPDPERVITAMDELRGRIRWRVLNHDWIDDDPSSG